MSSVIFIGFSFLYTLFIDMKDELNLWEEKNSTGRQKNLSENVEKDNCGIITETKQGLTKPEPKGITKISGIYKIINKVNDKYYVGSSKNIYKRWNEHKSDLNRLRHKNSYLQKSYNKHKLNNFDFIILETIPPNKLIEVEQKYLDIAKQEKDKCYNLNFLADRLEMTDEIRRKIGNGNKGHKMTLSNKLILMEFTKNRVFSEEYRRKISKGTKLHTPRGKNNHRYNHTIYTFKNINTSDVFTGTHNEFKIKYNLSHGNLSNMIIGKRKSIKGWILVLHMEHTVPLQNQEW